MTIRVKMQVMAVQVHPTADTGAPYAEVVMVPAENDEDGLDTRIIAGQLRAIVTGPDAEGLFQEGVAYDVSFEPLESKAKPVTGE